MHLTNLVEILLSENKWS